MFENEKKYFMDVNCFCRSMNKDEECDERCSYFNKCSKNNSPTNCLTRLNQCEEVLNTNKDVFPHELVIPGIYSHFKRNKNSRPNDYMYVVLGLSEPLETDEINRRLDETDKSITAIFEKISNYFVTHTETNAEMPIFGFGNDNKKLCHNKHYDKGKLVIYKSLYDTESYARPYDMFMEEVPEGKDNPSGQKYIFELVRY